MAGSNIEGFLEAGRVKEAWEHIARWYRQEQGKQYHHTREGLKQELAVRAEIYRCRPPASLNVPTLVHPAVVNDNVPTEAKVELLVQGLKVGRAGGPLGMRSEVLKWWRKEDKREKDLYGRRWELVARLVQVMFRDGKVTEDIAWAKMVLVLKGKGEYRDIGLVEVMWKVCLVVVNCRLKMSVGMHAALHGSKEGRGTRKTTLESNMDQHLAGIARKPLFQVFLDI